MHIEDDTEQLGFDDRWLVQALVNNVLGNVMIADDFLCEMVLSRSCSLSSSFPNF